MATDRRLISWDTLWDKNGTSRQILSQGCGHVGQPKTPMNQGKVAFVPPSQTLGRGTLGQAQNRGTRLGTVWDTRDRMEHFEFGKKLKCEN